MNASFGWFRRKFVRLSWFSGAMDTSTSFALIEDAGQPEGGVWPRDRFYDRAGREISVNEWSELRGEREYAVIGEWRGDDGSAVRTVWTGFGFDYGCSETQIFETHRLVGDQSYYDTYCSEADALMAHDDAVASLSRDSKPLDGVAPAGTWPGEHSSGFFDRQGNSIALAQWVRLRRDPGYCGIDRWLGEGGAQVVVHWIGFSPSGGFDARRTLFGLSVAAFENCPLPDSTYRFFTEPRALDHFRRIIPLVERGIRPWDDDEVKAAGFEPLVLRAW